MHLLCQINYASAKRSADVRPLPLWPSCATHGGLLLSRSDYFEDEVAMLNSRRLRTDTQKNSNHEYADLGSFVRTDGMTSVMADVNLASDTFHRSFTDVIPANEHGNDATLGYETRQARFPHPNPLPEGEGANESLREFYVNLQTAALPDMQGSDRVQDMNVTAANDAVFEMRSMG